MLSDFIEYTAYKLRKILLPCFITTWLKSQFKLVESRQFQQLGNKEFFFLAAWFISRILCRLKEAIIEGRNVTPGDTLVHKMFSDNKASSNP